MRYTAVMTPENQPGGTGDDPLDAIILAAGDGAWAKMAVFIAKVVDAAKAEDIEASGQAVAARIYVLVEAGKLEAKGNVRRWRAGEVRKKP